MSEGNENSMPTREENARRLQEEHNGSDPSITDDQYRAAAKALHESEGEVEIDPEAVVSRGDDVGAYVQAWVSGVASAKIEAVDTCKNCGKIIYLFTTWFHPFDGGSQFCDAMRGEEFVPRTDLRMAEPYQAAGVASAPREPKPSTLESAPPPISHCGSFMYRGDTYYHCLACGVDIPYSSHASPAPVSAPELGKKRVDAVLEFLRRHRAAGPQPGITEMPDESCGRRGAAGDGPVIPSAQAVAPRLNSCSEVQKAERMGGMVAQGELAKLRATLQQKLDNPQRETGYLRGPSPLPGAEERETIEKLRDAVDAIANMSAYRQQYEHPLDAGRFADILRMAREAQRIIAASLRSETKETQ